MIKGEGDSIRRLSQITVFNGTVKTKQSDFKSEVRMFHNPGMVAGIMAGKISKYPELSIRSGTDITLITLLNGVPCLRMLR
ncbi:MAG: hypothetical protein IPH20_26090 [Bacteroidales bacterium]|nr:hypothetical protein [Bacteroidales bacterium]